MKTLRPHQRTAIDMIRASLRAGRKRIICQAATGFGKTVIAADIVRMARDKSKRVLFCVDSLPLIDQTAQRFEEHGLYDIGIVQASHPRTDYSQPIQIASVQTLRRRIPPAFDFAIIDEAHSQSQVVWDLMKDNPGKVFIGLSATPWSKGLGLYYEELIVPVRMQQLIDEGYLCGFQVYAPSHPDLRGVKTTAGDYNEGDLAKVMGDQSLIADVVATWKARAAGRPTLCFCVDRQHAQTMRDRFEEAGVGCGYIDGETPQAERDEIRDALHDGKINVVTSVGVLTKGVDWQVGCISLARPTKSAMLLVQMIGRGLRVNEGRAAGDCIVLDHTDSVLRLGFPTDIHRDHLCEAKKGERQKPEAPVKVPKECPGCKRLVTKRCDCGYEPPRRQSMLTEGGGELAVLSGGRASEQVVKPAKAKPVDKERFYRELLGYAAAKGKTPSFALAIFKARHSAWPYRKDVQPLPPSAETLAYIRHRNLVWGKMQQRRTG